MPCSLKGCVLTMTRMASTFLVFLNFCIAGEKKDARQIACAQAVDLGLPLDFHARAQCDLALMAKRRGEHERAAEIWHENRRGFGGSPPRVRATRDSL